VAAFKQMIVTDVILDSAAITDKYAAFLKEDVANLKGTPIDAKNIPRNSILARSIHANDGQLPATSQTELVLPFFSPHICPPIKPGEVVWVFLYDPNEPIGQGPNSSGISTDTGIITVKNVIEDSNAASFRMPNVGYWIGRVSSFMQFDDINYTVFARKFGLVLDKEIGEYDDKNETENLAKGIYFRTAPKASDNPNVPSLFTNGAGDGQIRTIEPLSTIDNIFNNATANGVFEFEPVPRFTKRPGDLVLQGSNNTLISLGVDRTGPIGILNAEESGLPFPILSGSEESKVEEDFVKFAGTIDIVTGRGRVLPDDAETDPELTASRIINTDAKRGDDGIIENDKDPEKSDKTPNLNEGNPDFVLDSSRMYVSMRTNGDKNFALPQPPITDNSPTGSYNPKGTEADAELLSHIPTDEKGAAFIITKSDEIRIIARQSADLKINPESDETVNGSIKIVKEGEVGEDLAMIIMHPDGTVQIDAPRIILGRNDVGPFDDGPPDPGSDTETGYVKFSQYNVQMAALHDQVTTLANAVEAGFKSCDGRFGDVLACFQQKSNAPGFGSPVPGFIADASSWKGTWLAPNRDLATIPGTSPVDAAANVSGDVGGTDKAAADAGSADLKSNIPDARSEVIFGE
jgi:hypothetical protein